MRIVILRDPRESRAKCSLTPLVGRAGVEFHTYHHERRVDVGGGVLLDPEGELLTPEDRGRDLILIDCAWRQVPKLRRTLEGALVSRRLPHLETAYPRRSKTFQDAPQGLASIEALYAAALILGEPRPDLLEEYRWSAEFLERNQELLSSWAPSRP